eukprot:jgi/Chlat1/3404/Chrsp23S03736
MLRRVTEGALTATRRLYTVGRSFSSSMATLAAEAAAPTANGGDIIEKVVEREVVHNVGIIGSGPAGWTAALYAARADLKPIVFEGELSTELLPGGQLMTTTEVENFPGYVNGIQGPEMMEEFKQQAERFGTITLSRTVEKLDLSRMPIRVFSGEDSWLFKSVILATGASAKYLGLESEKRFMNKGVSGCATCDGALPRFRNKPIIVVGGGDTAMEEATFLSKFGSKIYIVHRRDSFRASKIMAQRALANPKICVHWNSVVEEILGDDKLGVTGARVKNIKTGETQVIEAFGYFSAIGHKPNSDLVKGHVEMDESGYIIPARPGTTYTQVEGLFACGDVIDKVYRQAITAAGSGCAAAIDATRWLEMNEEVALP